MSDLPEQNPTQAPRRHNRGLLLIAVYKFAQVVLFLALGVSALRLLRLHTDLDDIVFNLARHLRFNPESRFVDLVMTKASLVNDPMLKRIGAAAFAYAALGLAEGIGLYLEKAWGEFLTLLLTASFLPLECVELIRRQTWIRVSLFAINLAVFLFLLKIVLENSRRRAENRNRGSQAESAGSGARSEDTKTERRG